MITTRDHGALRVIQLARAPVNALDPALCAAVIEAVERAVSDGCVGIVLAGGQKVFSAGLDVPYLMSLGDDIDALRHAWGHFFAAARALAECPVPLAAAIAGHSPAGGCVLALCCDRRVMASGAWQIGLNETQVGIVVPEGVQRLLRRVVGSRQAERLLLTGAMIDSTEALAIGLVDELTDANDVEARALDWLQSLQSLPRAPMLATRAIARADLIEALSPAVLDIEQPLRDWHHPDTQAALRALLARLGK